MSDRRNNRVGVLFSGGLDSAALVAHLLHSGKEVWPVYVRAALRWEREEERYAQDFMRAMRHPRLKPIHFASLHLENAYRDNWSKRGATPAAGTDDTAVFLPARNLLLFTKAFLFLSSQQIYSLSIATLKGNPFIDGRPSYFRLLEKVLGGGFARKVSISAPFRSLSKAQVIRMTRDFPIHLSLSCIAPRRGRHCGRCNKCAERRAAFQKAGVEDRTRYVSDVSRSS